MTVNKLAVKCSELARCFASQIHALSYNEHKEKRAFVFTIITNLSKIEFVYIGKGSSICPPSTIFVRIFPLKTREVPFHLYEFMKDDFRCTYFTYIETEQRMEACFHCLSNILLEYLPKMEALVRDREKFTAFTDQKNNTVKEFLGIKDQDIPKEAESAGNYWKGCFRHFEKYVQLVRFTQFDGYRYFLEGSLDRAKASYEKLCKKGTLLPFEKRLYEFIQSPEAEGYLPVPAQCAAYLEAQHYIGNKAQGLQLLKTGGILYLFFLILFAVTALAIETVRAKDTEYYSFLFYKMAPLLAALPAIIGSISLRRVLARFIHKEKWKEVLAFDDILNSAVVSRVAHILFGLLFAVCLFFLVLCSFSSPQFYKGYMVYNDGERFPLLNQTKYNYADIDSVYHIAGRYNDFGDYIDRGSYIVCFRDGSRIDFDLVLSEKETAEYVMPLLMEYVDGAEELYSDRDIL